MSIKIAFTGPESSGKTTLAKKVAGVFNGIFIEEYAREYLINKIGYEQKDLDLIAKNQFENWNVDGDLIIADTELTVIKIWSEYRYNNCSAFILEKYNNQDFNHYFLCKPDIPWEEDPLRENPNNREELFELYLDELKSTNRPFTIVEGKLEHRLKICKQVISSFFKE